MARDKSLSFDGKSTSIVLGTLASLGLSTTSFTIEAWFSVSDDAPVDGTLLYLSPGADGIELRLRVASARLAATLVDPRRSVESPPVDIAPVQAGWHHVAVCYAREIDGGTVSVCVDGAVEAPLGSAGDLPETTVLHVGASPGESTWKGQLSELRVWSVVHGRDERLALMHRRPSGTEPELACWVRTGAPLEGAGVSELAKQIETLKAEKLALELEVAELEAATRQPPPALRRPAVTQAAPAVGESVPSMPIGELVRSMATAIADAQLDLDKSSLMVAELMSGHYPLRDRKSGELVDEQGRGVAQPVMVDSRVYFGHHLEDGKRVPNLVSMMELGFVPNFYQFVDTVLEVKIAMKLERSAPSVDPRTGQLVDGSGRANDVRLSTTPIDAGYAASYRYDVAQSSVFKTKLVCVPPPVALEERLREVMRQEAQAAAVAGASILPEGASE